MKLTLPLLLAIVLVFTLSYTAIAQTDTTQESSAKKDEKVKTGFSFGGVPALAYDTDLGFLYGVILNFYHYGDGSNYPFYNHSLYLEWSRTTKGSGKNIIEYDNRTLLPNGRMKLEASYLTEQALDFYGFNGYQSYFGDEYINQEDTTNYVSRLYYRHDRKMLRLSADFQGSIIGKKLRWFGGVSFNGVEIGSLDLDRLNKGKEADEILPDTATLYDKYVDWGIITADQKNGGNTTLLKLGVVYDTRDNEASSQKGIWSEALLIGAPSFLGNKFDYYSFNLTHRQYFTLIPKKVVFAYRASYQGLIGGEVPFYMMPFYYSSKDVKEGMGGSKTLRGILRNRVVGDGAALFNAEIRYRFLQTVIAKQNFSITLSGFYDASKILQEHKFDDRGVDASYGKTREENLKELYYEDEKVHMSYGAGLHFAVNTNFIVAVDYGMAGNPRDGKSGLYIGLNYLF